MWDQIEQNLNAAEVRTETLQINVPESRSSGRPPTRAEQMVSASRSSHFRDIRVDFQERAKWLDDQIKTAEEQFDHALKRLEQEHSSIISRLRFELDNIKSVLEFEERRFNGLTS